MQIRVLTAAEITQSLSMHDAIEVMRQAFLAMARRQVIMPIRNVIKFAAAQPQVISAQDKTATAAFMPAYLADFNALGIKVASLVPTNPDCGIPLINAVVILLDTATGQPAVLLEGAVITALKTGATSGLATDLLAKQGATTLAVVGAGVQARAQLQAVCSVRNIEQIKIYSRTYEHAVGLAAEVLQQENMPRQIIACKTLREATREADIICSATTSTASLIDVDDVQLGVHINAVGYHTTTMRETSAALIAKAKVVVEQREATLLESCERNVIEIGDILSGAQTGRDSMSQITLFASVGTAMQDIAIAAAVWQRAREKGLSDISINL